MGMQDLFVVNSVQLHLTALKRDLKFEHCFCFKLACHALYNDKDVYYY